MKSMSEFGEVSVDTIDDLARLARAEGHKEVLVTPEQMGILELFREKNNNRVTFMGVVFVEDAVQTNYGS